MPINPQSTPNPNAMKFTVGVPVGGPVTYRAGQDVDHPLAEAILATEGVVSVFWTADFVTVSKHPGSEWPGIQSAVTAALEKHLAGARD